MDVSPIAVRPRPLLARTRTRSGAFRFRSREWNCDLQTLLTRRDPAPHPGLILPMDEVHELFGIFRAPAQDGDLSIRVLDRTDVEPGAVGDGRRSDLLLAFVEHQFAGALEVDWHLADEVLRANTSDRSDSSGSPGPRKRAWFRPDPGSLHGSRWAACAAVAGAPGT